MCRRYLLASITCCFLYAQQPNFNLHVDKTRLINGLPTGTVLNYPKCDQSGNVYLRYFTSPNPTTNPVIRITHDDALYSSLDLGSIPEDKAAANLRTAQIYDFSVSGGDVYLVTVAEDSKTRVVVFDSVSGKFKNVISLDREIHPLKLAVFSTGEILILGSHNLKALNEDHSPSIGVESALELFDRSGKFLKSISLHSDALKLLNTAPVQDRTKPIDLALLESSPQGAFLLPYGTAKVVYVINASGEAERSLQLPVTDSELMPLSLRVGPGQLLIEYVKGHNQYEYEVYSTESGERLFSYALAEPSGIFACYDWHRQFTFLAQNSSGQRIFKYDTAR